eukprot:GILJ01013620.1.p1 GENE.GILJ01013620.1~~GILJ01013620.1.p1  ORF type:complete len:171 (+),score=18.65 GILJ01013620.1:71-583(+)
MYPRAISIGQKCLNRVSTHSFAKGPSRRCFATTDSSISQAVNDIKVSNEALAAEIRKLRETITRPDELQFRNTVTNTLTKLEEELARKEQRAVEREKLMQQAAKAYGENVKNASLAAAVIMGASGFYLLYLSLENRKHYQRHIALMVPQQSPGGPPGGQGGSQTRGSQEV